MELRPHLSEFRHVKVTTSKDLNVALISVFHHHPPDAVWLTWHRHTIRYTPN